MKLRKLRTVLGYVGKSGWTGVLVLQDVGTMKSLLWWCEMWFNCVERKRSAKLPSYVPFVCVCVYMCMRVCVQTCLYVYICMYVYICTSMRLCTCVCVCVCIFVHRLWAGSHTMLYCTRHLSAMRAVWSALSTQCTVNLEHSNA